MSDYTTNATVNLSVNGQRAVERLQELRQQAMNLSEAISKAAVAERGSVLFPILCSF